MSCHPSARRLRKLTSEFTELHEGLPPDSISCESYAGPKLPVRKKGRVVQIDYDKIIPTGKQWYYHPIQFESEPILGFDRQGVPVVYAGKIHVTTHGIEDLPERKQSVEHIPRVPRSLTVFGRLRQIRYKPDSGSRTETWKPSRNLALAHDERGELHVLKERAYKEGKMAKHRKNRRRNAGDVLSKNNLKNAGTVVLVGAGSAVVGAFVNNWLSKGKVNPALPVTELNPARLSGYKLAAVEMLIGGALGAGTYMATKKETLSLAVGVGPAAYGVGAGIQEFQNQRAKAPAIPPGPTANGNGLPEGGKTAGYPMPGGLPQGYYPVPRAACAVR